MKKFANSGRTRRTAAMMLIAAAGLMLSGCLTAKERTAVKYDAGRDEFELVTLLENIRAENRTDLEFLAAIYGNRDHYVAALLPQSMLTRMMPRSLLRLSADKMVALNFYGPRPMSLSPIETTIPLETVEITPGMFFEEKRAGGAAGKGTGIGFYQGAKVPGKTVDIALAEFSKKMQEAIPAAFLEAEVARRALGGKAASWDEVKTKVMEMITIPMPKSGGAAQKFAMELPLDTASLQNVIQAIKARTLNVGREKQVFSVVLPLSEADCGQILELMTQGLARVDAVIAANEGKPEAAQDVAMWKSIREIAGMIHIEKQAGGAGGLRVSLDVVEQASKAERAEVRVAVAGAEKPREVKPGADVEAFLQGKHIVVSDKITPETILRDFAAGRLKGYPSAEVVVPGKGITGG